LKQAARRSKPDPPCTSLTSVWPPHALKGDIDEAKSALTEARRLNPKLSVKWMLGTKSYPNYSQAWYDALRKAGLPEE
jgi:hypothetical protein